MELTKDIVMAELSVLNTICRPPKTADEIELAASVFVQDCGHLSSAEFIDAVSLHRRNSPYWPTPKEIIDRGRQIRNNARMNQRLLPFDELSDEQIALNLKKIRGIKKMLAEKNSINRAIPRICKSCKKQVLGVGSGDKCPKCGRYV